MCLRLFEPRRQFQFIHFSFKMFNETHSIRRVLIVLFVSITVASQVFSFSIIPRPSRLITRDTYPLPSTPVLFSILYSNFRLVLFYFYFVHFCFGSPSCLFLLGFLGTAFPLIRQISVSDQTA